MAVHKFDVLIIGAGLEGLEAGIAIARAGVERPAGSGRGIF